MPVMETMSAQQLIEYSNKTGYKSLPMLVSSSIAKIRKVFANAVTTDINRPLEQQIIDLSKACKDNNIEIENEDMFCYNEFEAIRKTYSYKNPTTNETGEILIDVYITTENHENEEDETEENQFLICPDFADVVISINGKQSDFVFQDIVGNQLAKLLKGGNVKLQINNNEVEERTFVYDGCHKIYTTTESDRQKAIEYGYIVNGSIDESEMEHPIIDIEEFYLKSCPLRFIQRFSDFKNYIPQCSELPMFIYY